MSGRGVSGNDTSPIKEAKRPELAQVAGRPGSVWGFSRLARSCFLPALLSCPAIPSSLPEWLQRLHAAVHQPAPAG